MSLMPVDVLLIYLFLPFIMAFLDLIFLFGP